MIEYQRCLLPNITVLTMSVHTANSIDTALGLTRGNFTYAQTVAAAVSKINNSATALLAYLWRRNQYERWRKHVFFVNSP